MLNASRMRRRALLAAVAASCVSSSAYAIEWSAPGNGTFNVGGNWVGGVAPAAGQDAGFNTAPTYTVSFTTSPNNLNLNVGGGGNVTFASSGAVQTYTLTGDATVNGGNLTLGTAVVNTNIHVDVTDDLAVRGGSTLTVGFASTIDTLDLLIAPTGAGGNGTVVVDGTNSSFDATATTTIAQNGMTGTATYRNAATGSLGTLNVGASLVAATVGALNVQSNADVFAGNTNVATSAGSGSITVTGTGSVFNQNVAGAALNVGGGEGTGTISLTSSGVFTTNSGLTTVGTNGLIDVAGGTFNANGNITINGGTLRRTSGTITWASAKTMTIQNGGTVSHSTGYSLPSSAVVNVTGNGSLLQVLGTSALQVMNNASVALTSGGDQTSGVLNVGIGSAGTVTADGAGTTITATSQANIGGNGAAGNGSVTFTNGASGSLSNFLTIGPNGGSSGFGGIYVQSGSTVSAGHVTIAPNANPVGGGGSINLSDAGSAFTQASFANLTLGGAAGTGGGSVNIATGTTFTSGQGTTLINPTGHLAVSGGTLNANGTITLDGGRLQVTNSVPGSTFVWAGGKTMTVQAGGRADLEPLTVLPTNAIVHVTGAGSQFWNLSGFDVSSGSQFNVSAGGVAQVMFGPLTIGSSGNGSVAIDGSTSAIALGNTLVMANAPGSVATFTLSNNATASVAQAAMLAVAASAGSANLFVQSNSDLTTAGVFLASGGGTANVNASVTGFGSTWTSSSGSIVIGHASSGGAILNVTSGGTFTSSTSQIDVHRTGTIDINGGTFHAKGPLMIRGGTVDRSIVAGSNFILDAGRDLTINDGGLFRHAVAFVTPAGSDIAVSGAGSLFDVTNGALFNVSGGSSLDVSAGGGVSTGGFRVGEITNGNANVTGAGSTFTSTGTISSLIGYNGANASLRFQNDATGTMAGSLLVGRADASAGGTGLLSIESGADLSLGTLHIGDQGAATGIVIVHGNGSTITHTGAGGLRVGGFDGSGALNILDGGTFTITGASAVHLRPTGQVNIDGGSLFARPIFQEGGVLNFTAGLLRFEGDLVVGNGGLLGENLQLTNSHTLTLTGTTTIEPFRTLTLSGGKLSTGQLVNNGTLDFQHGTLSITGAGGLTIGGGGALGSSLTLAAGANVTVTNAATVSAGASLMLNGGNFTAASLTNGGTVVANGGALSVSGTIDNQAAGLLAVGSNQLLNTAGAITNAGEIQLQGLAARITGAGAITNTGLIRGDGRIGKPVTNSAGGEIRVENGERIAFQGTVASNAGRITLLGGTAEFTGGGLTNGGTGLISGRGTLMAPALSNNGQVTFSAGLTDVFATLTNNSTGKVFVTGGGTSTFYSPVTLNSGGEFRVSTNSTAVFLDDVTGFGPGSFTGSGTKIFEAGATNISSIATPGKTIVEAPATLTTGHVREASLTVNGAVTIAPNGTAAGVSRLGALAVDVDGGAVLALNDNDLIVDYASGDPSPEFTIRDLVVAGMTGAGITTLTNPAGDTTLAVAEQSEWGFTEFDGFTIDDTTIIGKYTYYGDANLDGRVTSDDYVAVDVGLGVGNSWVQGDFNYSGTVTSDDYVAIDVNLGKGTPTPLAFAELKAEMIALHTEMFGAEYVEKLALAEAEGFAALVPEPGAAGALGAAAGLLIRRRRGGG